SARSSDTASRRMAASSAVRAVRNRWGRRSCAIGREVSSDYRFAEGDLTAYGEGDGDAGMVGGSMLVRLPAVRRGVLRRWVGRPRAVAAVRPPLAELASLVETTEHLDRLLAAIAAGRRSRRS